MNKKQKDDYSHKHKVIFKQKSMDMLDMLTRQQNQEPLMLVQLWVTTSQQGIRQNWAKTFMI